MSRSNLFTNTLGRFAVAGVLSLCFVSPAHADLGVVGATSGIGTSASSGAAGASALATTDLSTGQVRATYTFHLNTARGGAQPSLQLSYRSDGPIGEGGRGWTLGMGAIERRGSPWANYRNPPAGAAFDPLTVTDRFFFADEALVPICTVGVSACPEESLPKWAVGWHYFRLQREAVFARFFWSPDGAHWRMQMKNGETLDLDPHTVDTRFPAIPNAVRKWDVVRRTDIDGNDVVYTYDADGNLIEIFDTSSVKEPNSLPQYAHHVLLTYGVANRDKRPLTQVDVASATFNGGGAREMVRRYHLSYDSDYRLTQVAEEGQCSSPLVEVNGALPASNCPTLPATVFTYSQAPIVSTPIEVVPTAGGFGHGSSNGNINVIDLTSDGLPDVYEPATTPTGSPIVHVNVGGTSWQQVSSGILFPSIGADAQTVLNRAKGVSLLGDWLGDGRVNLLWTAGIHNQGPHACDIAYATYSPRLVNGRWLMAGGDSGQTINICILESQRASGLTALPPVVADINGDGLVDVGQLSVGGDTASKLTLASFFSKRTPSGIASAISSGIYSSGATATFEERSFFGVPHDPTDLVTLEDMDSDGIPDLVSIQHAIVTWRRGDGVGNFDAAETLVQGSPGTLPGLIAYGLHAQWFVHDVTGDGRADLILGDDLAGVVVWENQPSGYRLAANVPANGFTAHWNSYWGTPFGRLTFADMNGSGVDDIVLILGSTISYFDLLNGSRAGLLIGVDNSVGETTSFDYQTTVQLSGAARAAGHPWSVDSPQSMYAVTRSTVRSSLVGRHEARVTEYAYRDPAYDGWDKKFRGFRTVRETTVGDTNSPTSASETSFFIGPCQDASNPCSPDTLDNDPLKTVASLPILTEQSDGSSVYLSTRVLDYQIDDLYQGLDGRTVRFAHLRQADTYLYDTASFDGKSTGVHVPAIEQILPSGGNTTLASQDVRLRASGGREHLRLEFSFDRWGNDTQTVDRGRIQDSGVAIDRPITRLDQMETIGATGWQWGVKTRTLSFLSSAPGVPLVWPRQYSYIYDDLGHLSEIHGGLVGTLPLLRSHEGGAATAPLPADASHDGDVLLLHRDYDHGNVVHARYPNGRCEDTAFDQTYLQLAVGQTAYPAGCGSAGLTTAHRFNRGLEVATMSASVSGSITMSTFDGFGRLTDISLADSTIIGMPAAAAAYHADYFVSAGQPVKVHASTLDSAGLHDGWSFLDGLGQKQLTLRQADPGAGDGGSWLATGLSDRATNGRIYRTYLPWFQNDLQVGSSAPPASSERVIYDAFGRVVQMFGTDGAPIFIRRYHALSVDHYDAEDLNPTGEHFGTQTTTSFDGHARLTDKVERVRIGGALDTLTTKMSYLDTGEVGLIVRSHSLGGDTVARWMRYDSLGRLVENGEPNTSSSFSRDPSNIGAMRAWRYAYNDNGDLVGTSDARGCGKNIAHDAMGRVVSEDYSPCLNAQAPYTSPQPDGTGTESFNVYDAPEAGQTSDYGVSPSALVGRLVSSRDLGAHTRYGYDGRGRLIGVARRIVRPGAIDPMWAIDDRYTRTWFRRSSLYDDGGRLLVETTGASADVPALLGEASSSLVHYNYSARGTLRSITSSYGPLVDKMVYEADGQLASEELEDAARTTIRNQFDSRRRLSRKTVVRNPSPIWSQSSAGYTPPAPQVSTQLLLADWQYGYDLANNPTSIRDLRNADEWPNGAKPVSRRIQYDDLYRATRVDYAYAGGTDRQTSPFDAENQRGDDTPFPGQVAAQRVGWQSFAYDWLGNTSSTHDDASIFFDRSLGTVQNGIQRGIGGPEQLIVANESGDGAVARYDASGNLLDLVVARSRACDSPSGKCSHRFHYDWDEVGQLVRARRWDYATVAEIDQTPVPAATATVDLAFQYSGGQRVLKSLASHGAFDAVHTAFIFPSLRLDHARYDGIAVDYERTAETEVLYLAGVARVVPAGAGVPQTQSVQPRVLFEMQDDLGSTTAVIDRDTGELVERQTYQPFGAAETDYRPARWDSFREPYRYTGKEDDFEVGLTYFGARYYSAALGRWISPDPATIHGIAADPNPYAYVQGHVMSDVDSLGLCNQEGCNPEGEGDPDGPSAIVHGDSPDRGGYRSSGPVHSACNGPCPPPAPPPPCQCATYAQAQDWARSNPLLGIAFGGGTVLTPGGWLVPAPPNTNSNFRFGMGAAQMAAGIVMMILGTGGEIAGIALDATGIGAVLGVPAGVVSAAVCVQGAGLFVAGIYNMSAVDPKALGPDQAPGGTPGASPLGKSLQPKKGDWRGRYSQWLEQQGKDQLPAGWDAHHRIPQVFRKHPDFKNFDFDAPANIRGVSASAGLNVHNDITQLWEAWRRVNPTATRAEIESFAAEIDQVFGHTYWPLK